MKNISSDMLMLAISAIITLIILEYIYKSLKLRLLTWFYWKSLNKPNIIYIINKIIKPKYENLAFFMTESGGVYIISKIMLFINNIEDV